jgi:cell division protein FtsQ
VSANKTYNIKQIGIATLWVILALAGVVLLVAAINKKDEKQCKAIEVNIAGKANNFFVEETDVLTTIKNLEGAAIVGTPISHINLRLYETELEKNIWIKKAQLFFDNNEVLKINIEEREPVARVFSTTGTSFYIDSSLFKLPLSVKFSATVPVFTGFPSDKVIMSSFDSIILKQVKQLSVAIQADTFFNALIDQVDITPQATFELVPKIGNHIIQFGVATDIDKKLQKLKLFYKQVMPNESWNKYSVINLQYANQIVAKRRGAEDVTADSIRAIQIMQLIAANAEKQASDSMQKMQQDNSNNTTDSTIILQSIERDEIDGGETITNQAVQQPIVVAPKTVVVKPIMIKPNNPKPITKPLTPNLAKPISKQKNQNNKSAKSEKSVSK